MQGDAILGENFKYFTLFPEQRTNYARIVKASHHNEISTGCPPHDENILPLW